MAQGCQCTAAHSGFTPSGLHQNQTRQTGNTSHNRDTRVVRQTVTCTGYEKIQGGNPLCPSIDPARKTDEKPSVHGGKKATYEGGRQGRHSHPIHNGIVGTTSAHTCLARVGGKRHSHINQRPVTKGQLEKGDPANPTYQLDAPT